MTGDGVVLPAVLAGAAAALLVGLPGTAPVRLSRITRDADGASARHGPRLPRSRRAARLAALLVAAPVLVLAGVVPAVLAVAIGVLSVRARDRRLADRSTAEERRRALEACTALADELRAGRAPAEALLAASSVASGPTSRALAAAGSAASLGGDVAGALRRGTDPSTGPPSAVPQSLRALAACWTVCAGSGTGLADAVTRLADGLRFAEEQRRAVDAELAGPRATARLLAGLPLLGLLLGAGLGGDPLQVLLRTPVGLACLVLGAALEVLGIAWTGRLVRRALG